VEGNAERGGAEALQLRPSLRCLPLTDIPQGRSLLSLIALFIDFSTSDNEDTRRPLSTRLVD